MKKTHLVFAILASTMALAGCNNSQGGDKPTTPSTDTTPVHEHTAGTEWLHDETNHWHTCTECGEKMDEAAHTFEDVVTAPTYEAGGYTTHTCSVCGYSYVDSETEKLEKNALATPVLTVSASTKAISWVAVEHATSYTVYDGETVLEEANTSLSIGLSETVGNHSITVVANSSEEGYKSSLASEALVYETKALAFEGLSEEAGVISINGALGYVTYYDAAGVASGLGFNATSYTVTESGKVSFSVSSGYDEEARVYYAGESINKSIHVVFNALEDKVLEDGSEETDADLADKYTVSKYNNGWVSSSASAKLDASNAGFTEGKCVKLNFWNHGAWFKFTSAVEVKDGYDGVSFTIKANSTESQFSLVFADNDGNYASYKLASVPTGWTTYNVRFDDAGWNVNGSGATIAQAAAAKGYASAKQLAATFSTYDLRVYHTSDTNGTSNSILIDDVKLAKTMDASSVNPIVTIYDQYILNSNSVSNFATLTKTGANEFTYKEHNGAAASPKTLVLTSTIEGETITLSSDAATFVGKLSADGKTIDYVSASGVYAEYVTAIMTSFRAGKVLDTFESYTETGTGFDQKNSDLTKVSGLRANYFSDYYSGNSTATSPVGGNNWSLMGSTDYVNLDTSNGIGFSKAMKHKVNNNTMRVMTGGLALGTATSQGVASKICFAVKGISKGYDINFRTFYMAQVTPSNQQDTNLTKPDTLKIAATDWQFQEVALKTDKEFYGFGMTFKNGPSTAEYTLIDNIYLVY